MTGEGAAVDDLGQLRDCLRPQLNHIIGCAELLLEDATEPTEASTLERILIAARSVCDLIVAGRSQAADASPDVGRSRETMLSKSRALLVEAMSLDAGDQNAVQRIQTAAQELLQLANSDATTHPIAEQPHVRVHVRGDAKPAEGRLLIVDDDDSYRDLLRRHLQREGYYVEPCADGRTALERLKTGSFDAVLLDLVMPGMDGLQVLDAIRADPDLNRIPVLMISAADDLHAIAESIQRGAEDYLLKPFDTVLLDARLRATLERKRLRDHERTRNLDLERVTAALKRSNEDLQRFAYAASHDLQAPVRTITTYLQLLQRRLGPRLKEDELEMIGFAQGAAKRMHTLIEDLLLYSRASTSQLKLERVDTQELLDTLLADMQVTLEEAGARVTSDRLPVIVGDTTGFRQLFLNLLGNAVKYRSAEAPRIHVGATKEDGYWCFSVRDNGQGIPPEYNKQIFVMFKRLHGDDVPGSGIGLAICQRIIERFGGRIWVDSEPGRGSNFCFIIPFADGV